MLSKGPSNEVFAARGKGHDPDAPIFGALDPADQALLHETVHGGTDRARRQIDDRAYRIDRQRTFVQQCFQHTEIREAEPGLFNPSDSVPRQGSHGFHHYKPDVVRALKASCHKNLNPLEVYIINHIDINMIDVM
jgi:hypothetical protein